MPYSSMSGGFGGGYDPLAHDPLGLDNSQSYLGVEGGGGMGLGMGSVLRDTAISGYDNDDSNRARFLASQRFVGVNPLSCSALFTTVQPTLLSELEDKPTFQFKKCL